MCNNFAFVYCFRERHAISEQLNGAWSNMNHWQTFFEKRNETFRFLHTHKYTQRVNHLIKEKLLASSRFLMHSGRWHDVAWRFREREGGSLVLCPFKCVYLLLLAFDWIRRGCFLWAMARCIFMTHLWKIPHDCEIYFGCGPENVLLRDVHSLKRDFVCCFGLKYLRVLIPRWYVTSSEWLSFLLSIWAFVDNKQLGRHSNVIGCTLTDLLQSSF